MDLKFDVVVQRRIFGVLIVQVPNSDFLDNECHWSCFDVDSVYVIVLGVFWTIIDRFGPQVGPKCIFVIWEPNLGFWMLS